MKIKKLKKYYIKDIIIFNKLSFIYAFVKYFFSFLIKRDFKSLSILLQYLVIFLDDFLFNKKNFIHNANKRVYHVKSLNEPLKWNTFDQIIKLVTYLFKYYKQNYYILLNYKNYNYILISIIYNIFKYQLEFNEVYIKWIIAGSWTLFISFFFRNKYQEYKNSSNYYNLKNFNKNYINKNLNFVFFWKIYYKYKGNYQHYLYIKNFFLLNKKLNKKWLVLYDFKLAKFVLKLNNYYDLLIQESIKNEHEIEADHVHSLFDIFIKKKLDTPFIDSDIPFTFFYLNNKDLKKDKKILKKLSYLISYEYLYNKRKKSVLSSLTEQELWLNYKNFYKWTINKNYEEDSLDVFNVEGNEPYLMPARPYKKFRELLENSNLNFEKIFKDIDSFNLNDLKDVIVKAFQYINDTDIMYSINTDILHELKDNYNINDFSYIKENFFFDYNIVKNDYNLTVWLNKNALNDVSFLNFLHNLKYLSNVTPNTFNIDLFENNCLNDTDLLNLFLENNFFYLDYFTLAMNSKKYNLCYLVFVFKLLKNIKNYELYYNNHCETKIKQYNKIVRGYHDHIFNKLNKLTNSFNSFIKYRINNIYFNLNNFDSNNFIKKLKNKNFNNIYRKNYLNNLKINYKKDYKEFLKHFDNYKSESNFEKKEIGMSNFLTFDEYLYSHIDIKELNAKLLLKQKNLENLMIYYNFKENKLINFADIGFYLYDIAGYENYKEDVFLFFEFRDNELLDFKVNDFNINNKIEFQNNYSNLYFHYLIKLFKNLKCYTSHISIENLVFEDNFIYDNFDNSMHEKRVDFLYHLESFLKLFKTIVNGKSSTILRFTNSLILHYKAFSDFNKSFEYHLLYDTEAIGKVKKDSNKLYELEVHLDHLMQVWYHILDKLEDLRKFHVDCINLLKLEKLVEFFDFPMFSKLKGFLLLKEAYYNCLEELVIEERAFDHAFNISMCLFRVFNKHYQFFKQQVIYKNGLMTQLAYLELEDWKFVFELEKENPLILIELYNSKQYLDKAELFNNSVTLIDMVYKLSNIHEKKSAYNLLEEDWEIFLNEIQGRDIVIYNLTYTHIIKVKQIFEFYLKNSFNQLDLDDALNIFLEKNNLEYNHELDLFIHYNKIEEEDQQNENNVVKKKKKIKKEIEKIFNKNENLFFIKKSNNILYEFHIFNDILDKYNLDININHDFLNFLESKIEMFPKNNFTNYLWDLFYILKVDYKNFTSQGVVDNNYFDIVKSFNYLFYLIIFYSNISNEFDSLSITNINDKIINNKFNYLNDSFINLSYINCIFKTITKKEMKQHWSEILSRTFNNRFLFIHYDARDYLLNVFDKLNCNVLFKENTLSYLPKLNDFIINSNYNMNLIYNLYNSNFIDTFNNLFNSLNLHILKVNYMLKQLDTLKILLKDIYLNHCKLNKNNFYILKNLYYIIYEKKDMINNDKYLSLINLLLYVKDPIYLYNILTIDLKLYIKNLLDIFNIIQEPNYNNSCYSRLLQYIMYKKVKFGENWTKHMYYKGWAFNLDASSMPLVTKEEIENTNINFFFTKENIFILTRNISNLDYYSDQGYFNFDLFWKYDQNLNNIDIKYESNTLLNICNVSKLLKDFNDLFSINNLTEINFYSLNEFLMYNDVENFKSFDTFNYDDYLNFMIQQKSKFRFYFIKNIESEENEKKVNFASKEDLDIFKNRIKKLKDLKRKSSSSKFYIRKKKKKNIQKRGRILYFDEFDDDYVYQNLTLEVTDDEKSESESEPEEVLNQSKVKRSQIINIQEIKRNVVSEVHKNFKQWYSDMEFNEAYQNCKKTFEDVLLDLAHPIWDENRHYFPNEKIFLKYIKQLNENDKNTLFDMYWDLTIKQVLKNREIKRSKWYEGQWEEILEKANNKIDFFENRRCNEILDIFCTNLKYNENWKKKWHNKFFFLDKSLQKSSNCNWHAENFIERKIAKEKTEEDRELGHLELNRYKWKQPSQLELWNPTNWWKKW